MSWDLAICALLGTQVRAERLAVLQRPRRVFIVFDNDQPLTWPSAWDSVRAWSHCPTGSRT